MPLELVNSQEFPPPASPSSDNFLTATIPQVYKLLLTGAKIAVPFLSKEDAEKFRISMHNYKRRQDIIMLGIGMIEENEKETFSFTWDAEKQEATMKFHIRKDKVFAFKIVDDSSEEASEEAEDATDS